ncbi:SRPBCC domain-containing protein [Kaistella yonginensis]|uniref:SRPBCC domain-containing protein n=1 Tax=Kaistella yonginensis TaxID=658267 RepID=UPI0025B42E5F|nr:SRPBCC domain-containing protein [Kaistella yonginensis]MDN3607974.1 SRPBCC domain-containing protein [Kaistella yonginensis]
MKKLEFSIEIKASKEKVWEALWNNANYRKWTATFIPGSYYEGELREGSNVRFLSPGENGMFTLVEQVIPFKSMHFKHFGEVIEGINQAKTYGDEAIEQYDLVETDEGSLLTVTLNTEEEYITYFTNSFPRALHEVKEIAESYSLILFFLISSIIHCN